MITNNLRGFLRPLFFLLITLILVSSCSYIPKSRQASIARIGLAVIAPDPGFCALDYGAGYYTPLKWLPEEAAPKSLAYRIDQDFALFDYISALTLSEVNRYTRMKIIKIKLDQESINRYYRYEPHHFWEKFLSGAESHSSAFIRAQLNDLSLQNQLDLVLIITSPSNCPFGLQRLEGLTTTRVEPLANFDIIAYDLESQKFLSAPENLMGTLPGDQFNLTNTYFKPDSKPFQLPWLIPFSRYTLGERKMILESIKIVSRQRTLIMLKELGVIN